MDHVDNGSPLTHFLYGCLEGGCIELERGVRQGCALARALFFLAVDALVTFTTQACSQRMSRGYRMTSYLEVIPLLPYADDIMFSLEGLVEKAWNLCSFQDLFADIWVF